MVLSVARVRVGDWVALKGIRLAALEESPDSFATQLEEAVSYEERVWVERASAAASGPAQATFFVFQDDRPALGMITGLTSDHDSHVCQLVSMWVDPRIRGQGHGRTLVDALVAWASASRFESMTLWVTTTNWPAVRLYRSVGFAPTGKSQSLPSNPHLNEAEYTRPLKTRIST